MVYVLIITTYTIGLKGLYELGRMYIVKREKQVVVYCFSVI